jgi:hypothetical protein
MAEVRSASVRIAALVAAQKVKVKIGPQGAIAFIGIPDDQRVGMTDACIYRRIMASGTHAARQEIVKAERLAGRGVDKRVVAQGIHSHDNGASWHPRG